MLNIPEKVKGISHPMVRDVYIKKDFSYGRNAQDVLVIETFVSRNNDSTKSFSDFLIDLQEIEHQVEQSVGHIDCVDIVTH